jgi:hypothetical protein
MVDEDDREDGRRRRFLDHEETLITRRHVVLRVVPRPPISGQREQRARLGDLESTTCSAIRQAGPFARRDNSGAPLVGTNERVEFRSSLSV